MDGTILRWGSLLILASALALAGCEISTSDEGNSDGDSSGDTGGTFDSSAYPTLTQSAVIEVVSGGGTSTQASPGDTVDVTLYMSFPEGFSSGGAWYLDPDTTASVSYTNATLVASSSNSATYRFTIDSSGDLGTYRPTATVYDSSGTFSYFYADEGGSGYFYAQYWGLDGSGNYELMGEGLTSFEATPIDIVAAGGGSTVSTVYASPTPIDIGGTSQFTIAAGFSGYIKVNSIQPSTPYGIYVTDTTTTGTTPLTIDVSYNDGFGNEVGLADEGATNGDTVTSAWVSNAVSTFTQVIEVDNTAGTAAASFQIAVQSGLAGGPFPSSPTFLNIGATTSIGATFNKGCYSFTVASGQDTATLTITDLTIGVDVDVYNVAGDTVIQSPSSTATSNRTETFDLTSLTGDADHSICIDSQAIQTGVPAVGLLTITSPTP